MKLFIEIVASLYVLSLLTGLFQGAVEDSISHVLEILSRTLILVQGVLSVALMLCVLFGLLVYVVPFLPKHSEVSQMIVPLVGGELISIAAVFASMYTNFAGAKLTKALRDQWFATA